MTQAPNWYADPFGRFELRFFDGSAWTPYVRNGEEHAIDEPAAASAPMAHPMAPAPSEATAPPMVPVPSPPSAVTPAAHLLLDEHRVLSVSGSAVLDEAGTRLGEVRRGLPVRRRPTFEIVDHRGMLVAALTRPAKGDKKSTFDVVDGVGTTVGRIRKDTVRGTTAFGLEGPAELLGFLRAGADRDFRIEDRLGRTAATGTRTETGRVVRVEEGTAAQLRPMLVVAALAYDVALA